MRVSNRKTVVLLVLALASSFAMGCAKQSGGTTGGSTLAGPAISASVVAAQVASGALATSTGLVSSLGGTCPAYAPGQPCAGSSIALAFTNCNYGATGGQWSGGETLTFSGSATCGTTALPITNSGNALTRTFGGTIGTNPTFRTSSGGAIVQFDTQTPSGYSQPVTGGFTAIGNGAGQTITLLGEHLVSTGQLDMTLSSSGGAALTVINPGSNPIIQSGSIFVQDNANKNTAIVIFSSVTYTSGTCVPQSGSVTTTYSGSKTGNESLTFTGSSGATLVSNGTTTSFTISDCY